MRSFSTLNTRTGFNHHTRSLGFQTFLLTCMLGVSVVHLQRFLALLLLVVMHYWQTHICFCGLGVTIICFWTQDIVCIQDLSHDVFSQILRGLSGAKVTRPGKFRSSQDGYCVRASLKAEEGTLYPLEKSFFFLPKPPTLILHEEVVGAWPCIHWTSSLEIGTQKETIIWFSNEMLLV